MSIQIVKAGIFDSIQDAGRYGFQHLGINPGGAMDRSAAMLGNALLGKDLDSAVIEMHFPASQIFFEDTHLICITGANFSPSVDGKKIPIAEPLIINRDSTLKFERLESGARCYLT